MDTELNELESQVSNVELSQKLKQLGLNKRSLFSWWEVTKKGIHRDKGWYLEISTAKIGKTFLVGRELVHAYISTELGELLPHHLNEHFAFTTYKMDDKGWWVDYVDMRPETICHPFIFYGLGGVELAVGQSEKTEADARAKLLIFLLENHLINPDKDAVE